MFDSMQEAEDFGRDLSNEIKSAIERRCRPIENRFAALEARLARAEAALEQRAASLKYLGTFKLGAVYTEGSFVTLGGSVWHVNKTTREKPGDGNQDWQLAVKHGERGRDAKDAP